MLLHILEMDSTLDLRVSLGLAVFPGVPTKYQTNMDLRMIMIVQSSDNLWVLTNDDTIIRSSEEKGMCSVVICIDDVINV